MKTIEKAETLTCPFIQDATVLSGISEIAGDANICCITSRCMAWETTQTHERIEPNRSKYASDEKTCMPSWVDGKELPREQYVGYCRRLK